MTRLLSPDDRCASVEVPFGRSRIYEGTRIEVSDPAHIRALRTAGYTVADTGGAPVRKDGYVCSTPSCNQFRSFFKTCGRCGAACDRTESETD